MKKVLTSIFCLLTVIAYSQDFTEKAISSDIKEVTVFTEGCQIIRGKSVDLPKGNLILKFTGLSPYIDAKSVKIKTDKDLTILSVNHQINYLKTNEKDKETIELEAKLNEINDKIQVENTYKATLNDELKFLDANIKITGTNQTTNVQQLREAYNFYKEKWASVRAEVLEKDKEIKRLNDELVKYRNQLNSKSDKKEQPLSDILVKVENKQAGKFAFELSYLASNAGWLPTYDIIAKTIDDPIRLVYKANVKQDTKEDWKNVKLRLSSANPNRSGQVTQLIPYYVNYGLLPPVYNTGNTSNQLTGRVFDDVGEPMPFASIVIEGTTIGVNSDENGYYSLTLPSQNQSLSVRYTFAGYESQLIPINGRSIINVSMRPSAESLDAVVVLAYGQSRKIGSSSNTTASFSKVESKPITRNTSGTNVVAIEQVRRQTTVDFEIKIPYTIYSDGKNYTVSVDDYNVPADYRYYCAPKADKDVFLTADITGWEELGLLEGEANIFFENTYIGKTLIDTRIASDTLTVSLGRDKSVTVTRELQKNYTTKRFLGSKKEETRTWKLVVRNAKQNTVNLQLIDQIPVSLSSEVEVKHQNLSGGKLNEQNGEVTWDLILSPKQSKDLELKYQVKYPKSWNLTIE